MGRAKCTWTGTLGKSFSPPARLLGGLFVVCIGGAKGLAGMAEQQIGANIGINVAVEDLLHVAASELGAMVLDHLIGLHHVRPNLAAEADLGL